MPFSTLPDVKKWTDVDLAIAHRAAFIAGAETAIAFANSSDESFDIEAAAAKRFPMPKVRKYRHRVVHGTEYRFNPDLQRYQQKVQDVPTTEQWFTIAGVDPVAIGTEGLRALLDLQKEPYVEEEFMG